MSSVKRKSENIFRPVNDGQYRRQLGIRVRQLRAALGLSQEALSKALGRANNDPISRLERGVAEMIPFDILLGLLGLADKVGYGTDWLMAGRKPATPPAEDMEQAATTVLSRLTDGTRKHTTLGGHVEFKVTEIRQAGYERAAAEDLEGRPWQGEWVPIINRIAAGEGVDTSEAEAYPPGAAAAFVRFAGAPARVFAVEVTGDSMEPEYRDHDLVIADPDRPCSSGVCCVVLKRGGDRLPRLKRLRRRGGKTYLESLNPKYAAVLIRPGELERTCAIVKHLPFQRREENP
jgi:SOS-response transcriptional repressor LexA/DNA-binding XRE family transcriptional regulator